jgi:hypothetical protein
MSNLKNTSVHILLFKYQIVIDEGEILFNIPDVQKLTKRCKRIRFLSRTSFEMTNFYTLNCLYLLPLYGARLHNSIIIPFPPLLFQLFLRLIFAGVVAGFV